MTFTYVLSPVTDITRVRYHTGDTDSARAIFSDEEISFAISESGGWQAAVIMSFDSLIARIAAVPNFSADWLSMDQSTALKYYTDLLARKRQQFGIPLVGSLTRFTFRADSWQKTEPDYLSEDDPTIGAGNDDDF